MKKEYNAPYAEKIGFDYAEQVVASEAEPCRPVQPFTINELGCTSKAVGDYVMNT